MADQSEQVFIELSLAEGDDKDLAALTDQLKTEIRTLQVDSIERVSLGPLPPGHKAADWAAIGQMVVTLGPPLIPALFGAIKAWIERRPSTPVKIRIRVGRKSAQIEYDPTCTTAKELEVLVRTLTKATR